MKKILLIIFIVSSLVSNAQQDAQASMYFFNPLNYNPAYAGTRGSLNLTAVHRSQWVGWEGAPKTQFLSIHAPIVRKRIGLGANLSYDNIGSRSNISAMGNFAYHLQLNSKSLRLSFGASAGINSNQYDFNGLIVNDNTDIHYLTSNKSVSPNFGAGLYLHSNKGYLGFSLPRLIEKSIDNNTSKSFLKRHYYLTSGYVFNVNSVTDIKPSILIKYTQNAPITVDFNYSMFFYNKLWIGLMYRMHESVGFNSSFLVKEAFTLGYSFDYPINNLRLNNFGSHEILFSFDLRSKNRAFISPRYF